MKLGVVGKGGTGKTTISALVGLAYVARGKRVVAIDTDSNPNLAMSLGLDEDATARAPLVPRSLSIGTAGAATPAQLLADYGVPTPSGITLLHAMRVDQVGSGCSCANHASVRSVLAAAIEDEADLALVDMEAGLEHLGRSGGTLAHADILLMVMEPSRKSILTAARTVVLAEELGIPRVAGIANKATRRDAAFFAEVTAEYGVPLAGVIPFDPEIAMADRHGTRLILAAGPVADAIHAVVDFVDSRSEQRAALERERDRIQRRLTELSTAG